MTTETFMTLEDGEYNATSEDGGVSVERESALGIATIQLSPVYQAAPKLAEALKGLLAYLDRVNDGSNEGGLLLCDEVVAATEALRAAGIEVQP